ncbi:MAG: chemotaxis response regulator protein-glutamate methylesterase [Butyribacter sp.]|nr:chemotaxis response regulator protein-glutamate methylesterase [bacterium]MDY3854247.1 chemotaxis response regulator protein-glutamate methylesterase [Butyribacter sp.]
MRPIKVLVVDDSMLFRKIISYGLDQDNDIKVVAMAADPFQARDMILRFEPDVMTLDVEMPRMNGIDFLKKLMPQYPIPTVMISSLNETVFDAMNAGAVDFVNKPADMSAEKLAVWVKEELVAKIKIASTVQVGKYQKTEGAKVASTGRNYRNKILAMGASTGGTEAIAEVVSRFHPDIPGTVIVQHMPPGFTRMYAERLDKQCSVSVKEAENGDLVEQGKVLIAPGDRQMRLVRSGGIYRVEIKEGEKVSGHCPSVDVLFHSVAKAAASDAVGVLMTGMGADGAAGLLAMRKAGAKTVGQDEKSCVVYGMPKVAYDIGAVTYRVSLENIASKVYNIFNSMP